MCAFLTHQITFRRNDMTDRNKFEQMLEYLINEDKAKAEELFHELVVAKSREIYENLLDDDIQVEEEDDDVEENFDMNVQEVGGDPTDDFLNDVEVGDEGSEDEFGGDDEFGDDEFGGDEEGEEPATKDDVLDIKDAIEDLRAEFEAMLAGDDQELGGEEETEDEFGSEEETEDEFGGEEETEDETEESFVREYVEKVAAPKHGDNGANAKSVVAGKNDMGGTTANIAKGGESTKGGTQGGVLNPSAKDLASGNVNVPGGKAGIKSLKKVSTPAGGDDGQNKKSTLGA